MLLRTKIICSFFMCDKLCGYIEPAFQITDEYRTKISESTRTTCKRVCLALMRKLCYRKLLTNLEMNRASMANFRLYHSEHHCIGELKLWVRTRWVGCPSGHLGPWFLTRYHWQPNSDETKQPTQIAMYCGAAPHGLAVPSTGVT